MSAPRDAASPGPATRARAASTSIDTTRVGTSSRIEVARRVAESDPWWHSVAHRALAWLATSGQPFDAYALTELGVPDPDHPARWGALFSAAQNEGLIVPVGYRTSRRPTRTGGVCRVWIGAVQ